MDWGIELWDQFDSVDKHHQHEIEFSEKYAKFVKERCTIELEYAGKLRKLVKSYQPKKKEEDRSIFSCHKAFVIQMSELNDIAGQHEFVAEEMMNNVNKEMLSFCVDLKNEKKKIFQDGRHQQSDLEQQEKSVEQIKKKFEKESKECERAQAYFEKLDNDLNVTKIDVEKARLAWTAKKDAVEACKSDYVAALQKFNEAQDKHYNANMPKLFLAYKEADERRILKYRELMTEYINIDVKVKPLIQKCLEGMETAAGAIDPQLDAQLVIEKLKSGFLPPSDREFEDFTQPQLHRHNATDGAESLNRNSVNAKSQTNKKGGLSRFFGNKKQPKDRGELGPSPPPASASTLDVKKDGRSMTESAIETKKQLDDVPQESSTFQKSRTLSSVSALRTFNVTSNKKTGGLTEENRSSSVEAINKNDTQSGEVMQRKSSKGKSKLEFRMSIPVNKKRLKSMFRSNKDDHAPKIEVSGPITCDFLGSASNDDYLVPLSNSTKENEHPYDQVTIDINHGQKSDEKERAGNAESPDYSHLPPEQRRKKLQKLIDDLKKDISKEEEGRKAMMKMQEVYRKNPSMGDADSLSGQLTASEGNLEKLHAELSQLESWQSDATGSVKIAPDRQRSSQRSPEKILASTVEPTNKYEVLIQLAAIDHCSFCTKMSFDYRVVRQQSQSGGWLLRPRSLAVVVLGGSNCFWFERHFNDAMIASSWFDSHPRNLKHEQSFGDDFDEEPEPIGTCVALYDFEATSDGALSMQVGESFSVIEADNGDGWTRAMRGDVDGYVPTSYIDIDFFT